MSTSFGADDLSGAGRMEGRDHTHAPADKRRACGSDRDGRDHLDLHRRRGHASGRRNQPRRVEHSDSQVPACSESPASEHHRQPRNHGRVQHDPLRIPCLLRRRHLQRDRPDGRGSVLSEVARQRWSKDAGREHVLHRLAGRPHTITEVPGVCRRRTGRRELDGQRGPAGDLRRGDAAGISSGGARGRDANEHHQKDKSASPHPPRLNVQGSADRHSLSPRHGHQQARLRAAAAPGGVEEE